MVLGASRRLRLDKQVKGRCSQKRARPASAVARHACREASQARRRETPPIDRESSPRAGPAKQAAGAGPDPASLAADPARLALGWPSRRGGEARGALPSRDARINVTAARSAAKKGKRLGRLGAACAAGRGLDSGVEIAQQKAGTHPCMGSTPASGIGPK